MSNLDQLISGKEALIAIANGKDVEFESSSAYGYWRSIEGVKFDYDEILNAKSNHTDVTFRFRLKPKTITINDVELPAPFKPKEGEKYYFISTGSLKGWRCEYYDNEKADSQYMQFGVWRTREEVEQVVEVLRSVFKGEVK